MRQASLFTTIEEGIAVSERKSRGSGKASEQLPRIDIHSDIREALLPFCRLRPGDIWCDPAGKHRVGVLDATCLDDVLKIMAGERTALVISDPPYNIRVGNANTTNLSKVDLGEYLSFSRKWVENAIAIMEDNAHLYVWIGADYTDSFQPLPDFMIMMRDFPELRPRNLITVRKQRGYGTLKNWMWVRQEILYYVRGNPVFNVEAEYTDIPKVVRGYYKAVGGELTENLSRSRSQNIRAGNVWIDVQQVFYRLEENVPGCYAQKPLKAVERIIQASSSQGDLVVDFFAHSGSTLIAGERLGRRVYTFDNDPVFAE
ncbi:MAG: site-specific DNA-methyltransferase, partial [Armatimonadota bacterium]|nr:site-specific DNA-methyltransferase [bacterium]MDW8322094.1 site-specific DNA-methyltransferase [Armatimonadota bacterium]